MNNMLTAIATKISGSALQSYVGGRIYLDQAEQGAQFPYVVYFIVASNRSICHIVSIEFVPIFYLFTFL